MSAALASTSHYISTRFSSITTNTSTIRIRLQINAKTSSNNNQKPDQVSENNVDKDIIKKLQINGLTTSTATKNPAEEVQALLVGGALSVNVFFPSNEPDLWSIWMFSRPIYSFQAPLPCIEPSARRTFIVTSLAFPVLAFLNRYIIIKPALAEEGSNNSEEEGVVGALKSLFDPNEKTKSGKTLPKAYLKSAREVVKTLRESLNEDTKDNAKFRRTADSAKESIREYLSSWRGDKTVVKEESYVMLEKAIRALASFYSKAGPSASLPENVKAEILSDLNIADESL